jgi:hypothetical protein
MLLFSIEMVAYLWVWDSSPVDINDIPPMDFSEAAVIQVVAIALSALLGRSIRCAMSLGKPEENQEPLLPQVQAPVPMNEKKAEIVEP